METTHTPSPRQRVNLTVSKDVLEEARALDLNLSKAAEAGLAAAVKKSKEAAWLEENAEAIKAYNEWYEERGPLLKPTWMPE